MINKLRPCPFCGKEVELMCCEEEPKWIWCEDCVCILIVRKYKTNQEAINAWNKRSNNE